jgi:glucose-1-phosphate cytidylyltransferase
LFVEGDRVVNFSEKPQVSAGMINGGYFIFERRIFDYLTEDENCDFEFGPLQKLAEEGELMVYTHHGFWECMDTPRDVKHINAMWKSGKAGWKIWE